MFIPIAYLKSSFKKVGSDTEGTMEECVVEITKQYLKLNWGVENCQELKTIVKAATIIKVFK